MSPIVRRIQTLLDSQGSLLDPQPLRELQEEYAAAVTEVNDQLHEAANLVRRGLRSEAITMVSGPPSVIDQAMELEFPRFEEFVELIGFFDSPVPPRVDHQAIEMLNDAMVEITPIEKLLRRQRQLALARAPLAWRLRTLRAIAAADPISMHWQEDIESWEKVRHSQLAADVRAAIAEGDLNRIDDLHRELIDPAWDSKPPKSLIDAVRKRRREVQSADLVSQLSAAADQLAEASRQFDETGGHAAADRYRDLLGQLTKLSGPKAVPEAVSATAHEGLEWIDGLRAETKRQQQRAAALGQLNEILDRRGVKVADVESAYQQAAMFDETLPPELFNRYRTLVDELKLGARRRFVLGVAAVVATMLIIIGSLVFMQISRAHRQRVAIVETQLNKLLDAGQLTQATEFIDAFQSQQAGMADEPAIAPLIIRHTELLRQEADRAAEFTSDLEAIAAAETESLDSSQISELESRAVTEAEIEQAHEQRMRYQGLAAQRTRSDTEAVAAGLEKSRAAISQMLEINIGEIGPDDLIKQVDETHVIVEDLNQLKRTNSWAAPPLLKDIDSQVQRIKSLRQRFQSQITQAKRAASEMGLVLGARSPSDLLARLKSFVDAVPNHPRADDYRQVIEESKFWDTSAQWNQYLSTTAACFRSPMGKQSAEAQSEAEIVLNEAVSALPATIPKPLTDAIEAAASRRLELAEINADLGESLYRQLISVTERKGEGERHFVYRTYYQRNQDKFTFDPLASVKIRKYDTLALLDGSVHKVSLEGDFLVEDEPRASLEGLRGELSRDPGRFITDWDGAMLATMAWLRGRQALDSNLRQMLTYSLGQTMLAGTRQLKTQTNRVLKEMTGNRPRWENWYRPAPRNVEIDSRMSTKVYGELSQLYGARPQLKQLATGLQTLRLEPIGMMRSNVLDKSSATRQPHPTVQFWRDEAEFKSGSLMVVRRDRNDPKRARWSTVATIHGPAIQWAEEADIPIPGQLLFFCSNQSKSSNTGQKPL